MSCWPKRYTCWRLAAVRPYTWRSRSCTGAASPLNCSRQLSWPCRGCTRPPSHCPPASPSCRLMDTRHPPPHCCPYRSWGPSMSWRYPTCPPRSTLSTPTSNCRGCLSTTCSTSSSSPPASVREHEHDRYVPLFNYKFTLNHTGQYLTALMEFLRKYLFIYLVIYLIIRPSNIRSSTQDWHIIVLERDQKRYILFNVIIKAEVGVWGWILATWSIWSLPSPVLISSKCLKKWHIPDSIFYISIVYTRTNIFKYLVIYFALIKDCFILSM